MGSGLRCIMVWFHGNRAQAQVAIKKGTELTIRYTHMLQVHPQLCMQMFKCVTLQMFKWGTS